MSRREPSADLLELGSLVKGQAHHEWLDRRAEKAAVSAVPVVLNTVVGDSRTWVDLYATLAGEWPLLLVDVSNRGRAPWLGQPLPLAEQVRQVWAAVAEAGVESPVWVGSSSGTALAYRAAAHAPSGGLVLISPLFSLGMERRIALTNRTFDDALEDESLGSFYRLLRLLTFGAAYLEKHRFAAAAGLERLRELYSVEQLRLAWGQTFFPELDDAEALAGVACPVLALRGREEMLQPLPLLEDLLGGLDLRDLHTLPCGHALVEEEPTAVGRALVDFLASL